MKIGRLASSTFTIPVKEENITIIEIGEVFERGPWIYMRWAAWG